MAQAALRRLFSHFVLRPEAPRPHPRLAPAVPYAHPYFLEPVLRDDATVLDEGGRTVMIEGRDPENAQLRLAQNSV